MFLDGLVVGEDRARCPDVLQYDLSLCIDRPEILIGDDSRAVNTMVMRHRDEGKRYLKYYIVDFGSLLGRDRMRACSFAHLLQKGRRSEFTCCSQTHTY